MASLVAQSVESLPAVQKTRVQLLGQEDPLEREVVAHSRVLAWGVPWTEGPGGLQSMESRVLDTTERPHHHHHCLKMV